MDNIHLCVCVCLTTYDNQHSVRSSEAPILPHHDLQDQGVKGQLITVKVMNLFKILQINVLAVCVHHALRSSASLPRPPHSHAYHCRLEPVAIETHYYHCTGHTHIRVLLLNP